MSTTKTNLNKIFSLAVFFLAFIVYIITIAPTIISRDSAELITASYTLDIPHPSGYPLYIILGKIFSLLPIGSIALRINIMTALFGALTVFVLYWIVAKTLKSSISALAASLVFAFSSLFWFWTNSAEVFSLLTFLSAVLIYILIIWKNKVIEQSPDSFNLLIIFSFLYGLSFGNHHIIAFLAPAFLYFIFSNDKKIFNWKKILILLVSFFLGIILIYTFIFFRAKTNPFINWGDASNLSNLIKLFFRSDFGTFYLNENFARPWSFYVFYNHFLFYLISLIKQFTIFGFAMAAGGVYYLYKNNKQFLIFFSLAFIFSGLSICVLLGNMDPNQNILFVSERFYLLSFMLFALFFGAGVKLLLQKIKVFDNAYAHILILILLASLPIYNIFSNYSRNNKSNEYMDYDKVLNIINSVEENAIIITQDDNIEFGIWYFQQVENIRKDIKVILPSSSPSKNKDTMRRYAKLYDGSAVMEKNFLSKLVNFYMSNSSGSDLIKNTILQNAEKYPIYFIENPDTENLLSDYLISNGLLKKLSLKPSPNTYQLKAISHQNLWEKYQYRNPLYFEQTTHHLYKEIITQYVGAHNFLALAYMSQGENKEAAMELSRSFAIFPNNSGALTLQNIILEIENKEKIIDKVESPEFYFDLAKLYLAAQRYDDSEKYFQKAIEGGLDTDMANLNLAVAYLHQEKLDEAKKALEKSLSINPQNAVANEFYNLVK